MSKPRVHFFSAKVCFGRPGSFGVLTAQPPLDECSIYKDNTYVPVGDESSTRNLLWIFVLHDHYLLKVDLQLVLLLDTLLTHFHVSNLFEFSCTHNLCSFLIIHSAHTQTTYSTKEILLHWEEMIEPDIV